MTYEGETLFLKGWHIHSPSDHRVDGVQSKAEVHLVQANAEGEERVSFANTLSLQAY